MATKTEEKLFEGWNHFGDRFHLLNEDILKLRADLGTAPVIPIHENFTDAYKRLGDSGILKLKYTPETVYPCLHLCGKIVYATPKGVWIGADEDAAEILQNRPEYTTHIPPEETLVVYELIETGKNESRIWEYLTGNGLDTEKLPNPPKDSELGLSKTDWLGAAYFIFDEEDPREIEKIRKSIRIPIIDETIVISEYKQFKTGKDAFVAIISNAEHSIKILGGELDDLADPFITSALEDAITRGVDIQIISGPAFCIGRSIGYSKIYREPIELKDGLTISFSGGSKATIRGSFPEEKTAGTGKETAMLLSYIAGENNKPILFQMACKACTDAMIEEGETYDLLSLLGYNQYKNADFPYAVETFESAKKLAAGTQHQAEACSNLGFIYSKVRRYPEAIRELEEGIKLDGSQKHIHNNLATVYHLLLAASNGRDTMHSAKYLDNADTNYRIELENTPNHPTAERMLAQVNELEGLLS
ncbi:MAG: hypothetical protein U9Q92_05065 [archaeon]|nr:hypothetical protein [archaeon]